MNVWMTEPQPVGGAHHHAAEGLGTQLRLSHLPPMQWLGFHGMLWHQLLSQALKSRCQLEGLFLHLSENDLVDCPAVQLLAKIVQATDHIWWLLPKAQLVWVDMLPGLMWHEAHDPIAIDQARQKVNRQLGRV